MVFNNITGRRDIIPVYFCCPAIIMNQTLRTQIIQATDNTIMRFFQNNVIFNRFNPAHLYRRLKIKGKDKMSIKRIAPDITCRYADTGLLVNDISSFRNGNPCRYDRMMTTEDSIQILFSFIIFQIPEVLRAATTYPITRPVRHTWGAVLLNKIECIQITYTKPQYIISVYTPDRNEFAF